MCARINFCCKALEGHKAYPLFHYQFLCTMATIIYRLSNMFVACRRRDEIRIQEELRRREEIRRQEDILYRQQQEEMIKRREHEMMLRVSDQSINSH